MDSRLDLDGFDSWPSTPTATQLPPDCEFELRALARAIKATGLRSDMGLMVAGGVAGIVAAELYQLGYRVMPVVEVRATDA